MRQQQVREQQWKQRPAKRLNISANVQWPWPKTVGKPPKEAWVQGAIKCHKNRREKLKFPNCSSMWSGGNGVLFLLSLA